MGFFLLPLGLGDDLVGEVRRDLLSLLLRPARLAFVALGILEASSLAALLVATAISLQAVVVRSAAVARQKVDR